MKETESLRVTMKKSSRWYPGCLRDQSVLLPETATPSDSGGQSKMATVHPGSSFDRRLSFRFVLDRDSLRVRCQVRLFYISKAVAKCSGAYVILQTSGSLRVEILITETDLKESCPNTLFFYFNISRSSTI